ncbi:MAG: DUF1150 domain-containing protein [Methylovirgula sp.]
MLDQNKLDQTESPPFSEEQFAHLGGGSLAYVRELRSEEVSKLFPQAPPFQPGLQLFALLGADGVPIMLTDSRDAALANALQQELQTVSVH